MTAMSNDDALAVTLAVAMGILVALGGVVLALTAPTSVPISPAAYLEQNAVCRAATDACVVCSREGGAIVCSTPGIACQRETPRCLR
jgi:hypothetical protein